MAIIRWKFDYLHVPRGLDAFQSMPIPVLDPVCRDVQDRLPLSTRTNTSRAVLVPKPDFDDVLVAVN